MKLAIVSTYPPRPCGIGTFSADLRAAIRQADPAVEVEVVSIVADQPAADRPGVQGRKRMSVNGHPAEVTRQLQQAVPHDYAAVAQELNSNGTDVVLIEHEFGIFGGEAGEYVLALAAELEVPMVVTLHTVLSNPSEQQAATLRRLCEAAALVTVFTETASRMVVDAGIVSADRVRLVPHGAPPLIVARELAPTADGSRAAAYAATAGHGPALVGGTDLTLRRLRGRRVLSSFGLISSGKGLETAIRAVEQVVDRHPDVLYLIAGQTHPEVAKREGESYRQVLENLVGELGLQQHVHFLDRFLTIDELALLLSSTDLYLTPYRSREQIVSGALTFAVAAGCPVVSTPYLYAEDLLSTGAGVLVPFDDPGAMAGAINALLDDPAALAAARAESTRIGAGLSWNSVAAQTVQVLQEAVTQPAPPDQPDSLEHTPDPQRPTRPAAGADRRRRDHPARRWGDAPLRQRLLHRRRRPTRPGRVGLGRPVARAASAADGSRRVGPTRSRVRPAGAGHAQLHGLRPPLAGSSARGRSRRPDGLGPR